MKIQVERILGWERVLNDARITVGKEDLNKEPSEAFKKAILISEHSPIRKLMFEVTWEDIPYWVGMHLRTHHIGFKSGDDDLYFVQTQRSDRTQSDRNELPQDAPIKLRVILNAQTLINVSRVRLCHLASIETRKAWQMLVDKIGLFEPELGRLCVPNCLYRGLCPEGDKSCGYNKTGNGKKSLKSYQRYCGLTHSDKEIKEKDIYELLARIGEVFGNDLWTKKFPKTNLEEAAQQVAKHFPPKKSL